MQLLRVQEVASYSGISVPSVYKQVRLGFYTKPIKITARARRWPADELFKIIQARIAGLTDSEILELVRVLEASRQEARKGEENV